MRGSSARSLDSLLATVTASVDAGAEPHLIGNQLFEIVTILDQQPPLRRILTDPSTDEAGRARLADTIFGSHVTDATASVLKSAVTSRWSGSRDLADALEDAGAAAHVAGADKSGNLDDLEDDLFRFGRIVVGDPELRGVLGDRSIPATAKDGLLDGLLDRKTSASSKALIKQAVAARRGRFEPTLERFGEIAADRRERLLATVRTAYELGESEKDRLAAALTAKYGRDVHLNLIVDPDVVGGISVEVGQDIIDGTVASRLDDARRRIAG